MATNYVELLVRSRDEAEPDVKRLQERLKELGREVETARVGVDDTAAAAKLDRLQAKLAELKKYEDPEIKLRMSGALRVEAQIHAIEASLDNLKRKEDEAIAKAGATGLLDRILNGAGGLAGKKAGGPGPLPELPLAAWAALIPVAGALLNEIVGLASGFAAAGAGAGAFYLLAHPTISNLEQDAKNLLAAEQKLQQAQNLYAVDPTKAHAKALRNAQDSLKAIQMSMGQDAGGAAAGIVKLRTEYDRLTNAFRPDVFKVFNAGLKLANTLLPDILPFAQQFSRALDGLLQQAGKFAQSDGFKHFLGQFLTLVGPSVTAIGEGIGKVAVQLGKLLTVMSAKDVVNAINIAFTVLAGTIKGLTGTVKFFMDAWDSAKANFLRNAHGIATAARDLGHFLTGVLHDQARNFDNWRHLFASWGHDIRVVFDDVRHTIASWADAVGRFVTRVVDWFAALPGRILRALGHIGSLLVQAGRDLVAGFIRGIESMFGAVAAAAQALVDSLGNAVKKILHISSPSKVAHWWGEMIGQGLADGIDASAHRSAAAAARMAAGVSRGLGAYGGHVPGGAYGGPLRIELELTGSGDPLLTWLRQAIRVKGGNVQRVLGHG